MAVLRVGAASAVLGLVAQMALLLLAILTAGTTAPAIIAGLVGKIAWSVPICLALAAVRRASRGSPPLMGMAGLIAAPILVEVAGGLQQLAAMASGIVAGAPGATSLTLPIVRSLEYAALGAAVGWLGRRRGGRVGHLLVGVGLGLLAGAALASVRMGAGPPPTGPELIGLQGNETLLAGGCALILSLVSAGGHATADTERAEPEEPRHFDDNVQFTVYRPRAVLPRQWYPLLAFAHLAERPSDARADEPDPVEEVQRQATRLLGEFAGGYQHIRQDSTQAIPRQGEITFVPEVPGVEFNPPRRTFLWQESVHREDFRLRADAELVGQTVRGQVTVFLGSIVLAQLALSIRVESTVPKGEQLPQVVERARPYRKIFPSYTHHDMAIVREVERYARSTGDEYLRDVLALRAGEVWNDRLMQLIESADVFQLFWSTRSMRSPYVLQEYRHAISLNRPYFVRPVYWEDPLPRAPGEGLPPEELERLHFSRIYPTLAQAPPSSRRTSRWMAVGLGIVVLIVLAALVALKLQLPWSS